MAQTATAELHDTTGPEMPSIGDAADIAREYGEKATDVAKAQRLAVVMKRQGKSNEEIEAKLEQTLSLQGAVITVVVAGATAYAGINVMSSIGESMSLTSGDLFYNASQDLEQGVNDFFTNMPTVFVVIALVLIIGYLTILR